MPTIAEPRTVLQNPFNGETFVFRFPQNSGEAAFDVVLQAGGSGGGDALEHIHPLADETFAVRSGRLKVVMNGREQLLAPGDTATVARGTRHFFVNAHDGPTSFSVAFHPPQLHLRFFANFASLAQRRPQWFSAKGRPHFLLIALVLHHYRDHLYLAGPPIRLQKLLFAAMAPLAKVCGYRMEVEPGAH